jgi:hypothetical protein
VEPPGRVVAARHRVVRVLVADGGCPCRHLAFDSDGLARDISVSETSSRLRRQGNRVRGERQRPTTASDTSPAPTAVKTARRERP